MVQPFVRVEVFFVVLAQLGQESKMSLQLGSFILVGKLAELRTEVAVDEVYSACVDRYLVSL